MKLKSDSGGGEQLISRVTKPTHIKIGSVDYPIRWEAEVSDDHGRSLYGQLRHSPEDEVVMSSATSLVRQRESLLHEIIHSIDNRLDLALKEKVVGQLSVGLFETMLDNMKLMKWILGL